MRHTPCKYKSTRAASTLLVYAHRVHSRTCIVLEGLQHALAALRVRTLFAMSATASKRLKGVAWHPRHRRLAQTLRIATGRREQYMAAGCEGVSNRWPALSRREQRRPFLRMLTAERPFAHVEEMIAVGIITRMRSTSVILSVAWAEDVP